MDVTPMSMQMVVPRVSDAAQVQQNLNQAAALQQDFQAAREKADAKLKETQVRTKDNPEDGRIKDAWRKRKRLLPKSKDLCPRCTTFSWTWKFSGRLSNELQQKEIPVFP